MRKIIAKAVLSIVKSDVLKVAGSLQLCDGQDAVNEAAVHVIRVIYNGDSTKVTLDASNPFNCLNQLININIQTLCPPFADILINTYL